MNELSIEIEDIKTWPKEFLEIATQSKPSIIAYHKFKKDVEFRSIEDVALRYNSPQNPYGAGYQDIVYRLEELLNPHNIIGYHCTKLVDFEIDNIKKGGMKILSKNLVQSRLNSAYEHGYLLKDEYNYLINSPEINMILHNKNGLRTGKIYFSANRSTLKNDIEGLYRFFHLWGGEGIYWGHQKDRIIIDTLKRIGTPCIVKCSISAKDIEHYYSSLAERFLSNFIAGDIENPEPTAVFEMYVERNLEPLEIIEVIELQNPTFNKLTDYNNWNKYYK